MMKIKNVCNLDARQSMLVESAYYQCNPPQHSALKRKRRPVVQEWIRHLIFVQLGTDDVRKVNPNVSVTPTSTVLPGKTCDHELALQVMASLLCKCYECHYLPQTDLQQGLLCTLHIMSQLAKER